MNQSAFLQQSHKHLVFLISVGQEYHKNAELTAMFDLFHRIYDGWNRAATPQSSVDTHPYCHYRAIESWKISIIVADTLQAYNGSTVDGEHVDWSLEGKKFIDRAQPILEAMFRQTKLALPSAEYQIEFITWKACLQQAKQFHYDEYLSEIKKYYKDDERFKQAVDAKARRYLSKHPENKFSDNGLMYIFEELAVLYGSLQEGLLNQRAVQAQNALMSYLPMDLWLIYPANIELAFVLAGKYLKNFAASNNFLVIANVVWKYTSIKIYTNDRPKLGEFQLYGFSDRVDVDLVLLQQIDKMIKFSARYAVQAVNNTCGLSKSSSFKSHGLPVMRYDNELFVPRVDVFNDIKRVIKPLEHQIFVLQATGGAGKSSCMLDLALSLRDEHPHSFWFEPSSNNDETSFDKAYKKFAQKIGILVKKQTAMVELIKGVNQWLLSNPGWTLFFDNAKRLAAVERYLPPGGGRVYISTRSTSWPNKMIVIKVPLMSQSQATQLLSNMSGNHAEQIEMAKLAEQLGRLPLALVQAGALMRKAKLSPSQYATKLSSNPTDCFESDHTINELMQAKMSENKNTLRRKIVMDTWNISLEVIADDDARTGQASVAQSLLTVCSYLANEAIPTALLQQWLAIDCAELLTVEPTLLERVTAQLADVSLVQQEFDTDTLSLHALLQTTVRVQYQKKISSSTSDCQLLMSVLKALNLAYEGEGTDTSDECLLQQALLPHMQRFFELCNQYHPALTHTVEFGILCVNISRRMLNDYQVNGVKPCIDTGLALLEMHASRDDVQLSLSDAYLCAYIYAALARRESTIAESNQIWLGKAQAIRANAMAQQGTVSNATKRRYADSLISMLDIAENRAQQITFLDEAKNIYESIFNNSLPQSLARIYALLGRYYLQMYQLAPAEKFLHKAQLIYAQLTTVSASREQTLYAADLVSFWMVTEQFDDALRYLIALINTLNALSDDYILRELSLADAYFNQALCFENRDQCHEAYASALQAKRFYGEINDFNNELAPTTNRLSQKIAFYEYRITLDDTEPQQSAMSDADYDLKQLVLSEHKTKKSTTTLLANNVMTLFPHSDSMPEPEVVVATEPGRLSGLVAD